MVPQWPADKVERWPIERLVPYARNARTHSEAQIEQIAASIQEWGWTVPVLVDEVGLIIAGHGRVLAAARLGIGEVPVIVARGWTEAQKRAYAIADNKLALNAGWDEALLRLELSDLAGMGFDVPLLGFSAEEFARITGSNSGLTDPDEAPEVPAVPVSRRGDLWRLGRHWLICGDATSADDVARVLAGVRPHLMVTDPPYGVDYDPTWRKGSEKRTYMTEDKIGAADWRKAWALFPGHVIYIWHASQDVSNLWQTLDELGFQLRQLIIWYKMRFIIGRGDYSYNHEPCFYGVRKGHKSHWMGARDQPTVCGIEHKSSDTNHGAQKPVECMKRPIENNSSPGQAVYEPFSGSGTTIIAAEMTGRACHAIEIDPAYVDVAITRWQNFIGEKAIREGDGHSFDELAAADPAVCAA